MNIPRRQFLGLIGRTAFLGSLYSQRATLRAAPTSLAKAYQFLDQMMDLYAQGSTRRLIQSYVPTAALNLSDEGFTYDNAATLIAFLQRGRANDRSRATVLGRSLLYAQAHDPLHDGRIRDSYHTNPFILSNGGVNVESGGTATGNMAWTGLALAHLYQATGNASFRNAAVSIGNWVQNNTYDTRGAGGYTGGVTASQVSLTYKSTENNIDVYALFTMLASLTGDTTWTTRALYALNFIEAMWSTGGFFWTGTTTDGVTINQDFIPEDCQSWSYLALADSSYAGSLDWAETNLAATDGIFTGVSFSNVDTSGVWFEGTAHMTAALKARNGPGDAAQAAAYLQDLQLAQAQAPNNDGLGIDAASKDGLKTGDGDSYFAALHIGATSWYAIAAQAGNPFVL